MFNLFEQPWTLLIAAVITLLVLLLYRRILPDKRHWWQIALPAFLVAAALGLDFFIKTDTEKIKTVIKTVVKAIEQENPAAIEPVISSNYRDSYHKSKTQLISHSRARLSEQLIQKNIARFVSLEIQGKKATVVLTIRIVFDKQSSIYDLKRLMFTEFEFVLQKAQDNSWLINQAEILEIDGRPIKWRDISAAANMLW